MMMSLPPFSSARRCMYLIAALFVMIAVIWPVKNSHAQSLNFAEEENEQDAAEEMSFFDLCLSMPEPGLEEDTNYEYCACMDAHMSALEQKRADESKIGSRFFDTSQPEPEETISEREMLAEVHTPCLSITARDKLYTSCYLDPRLSRMNGDDKDSMCLCYASQMEIYIDQEAYTMLAPILLDETQRYHRDLLKMLDRLMPYRNKKEALLESCYTAYSEKKN